MFHCIKSRYMPFQPVGVLRRQYIVIGNEKCGEVQQRRTAAACRIPECLKRQVFPERRVKEINEAQYYVSELP